jgi:hypothetical protein
MNTTWGMLLNILRDAVADPDFVRKNSLMQDTPVTPSTLLADVKARVDALRPEFLLTLCADDVLATGGIVGTRFSLDALNRKIDVAAGAIGAEERVIFNAFPLTGQTFPPLEIQGWLFSSDTTATAAEIDVHYRFTATGAWHKLLQQDDVRTGAGVQFSLSLSSALGAPKTIKRLHILAKQI